MKFGTDERTWRAGVEWHRARIRAERAAEAKRAQGANVFSIDEMSRKLFPNDERSRLEFLAAVARKRGKR
jgi:hypothetical protein